MTDTNFEINPIENFDQRLIFNEHFTLGTIDLVQGGSFRKIIASIIIESYFIRKKATTEEIFSERIIILPPKSIATLTAFEIYKSLFESATILTGALITDELQEYIRQTVRVETCQTLQFTDLLGLIASAKKSAFIIITEAELYRSKDIVPPPKLGLTATRTSEDDWVPHIEALCQSCVKTAKDIEGYALVHVSDEPAKGTNNRNILKGIDDCYVIEFIDMDSPDEALANNAERWVRMAVGSKPNQAIDEINNLKVSDLSKKLLIAHILHRAKNNNDLLKLLYELATQQDKMGSIQKIKLAKIASDLECINLTNVFLSSNFDDLASETWLETALDIAIGSRNNEVIGLLDRKLSSLFPESELLRENRDRRLILNCHLLGTDDFRFITTGFSKHHLFLSKSLSMQEVDFNEIFEETQNWEKEWQELGNL